MRQLDGRLYADEPTISFDVQSYSDTIQKDPSWMDTLNANLGYQYKSYINAFYLERKYGDVAFDDSLNVMEEIKDTNYEQYFNDLKDAKNSNHLADMIAQIDAMKERREVLANSSLWAQLTTGLFDPLNLVALPFGGPTLGIARSAFRVGLGVTALQAPLEIGRQVFDPTATPLESGLNMGAAFAVGTALGGLIAVPRNLRANAIVNTSREITEMTRITNLVGAEQMSLLGDRASRMLQTDTITLPVTNFSNDQVNTLSTPTGMKSFLDENYSDQSFTRTQIRNMSKYFENEAHLRTLETPDGTIKGANNLAENLFTRSWLYKGVTNPYKRVLQSKDYSQETKMDIIKLMGDHGTALEGTMMGKKMPHSVYIKASEYESEWVKAYDDLLQIYGEVTGKGKPVESKFDYHFRRKPYDQWLEDTWKKSLVDPASLTPLEVRAVNRWNKFFEKWEQRLTETGHLGSDAGLQRRISSLTSALDQAQTRLTELTARGRRTTKAEKVEINELSPLIARLRKELKQDNLSLASREGDQAFSRMFRPEKFFPRFWNKQKIREQREQFKEILQTWFAENPNAYVYNPRTEMIEAAQISRSADSIENRIDDIIETLLNEGDPFANISYGYGKSKHFRHRMIDIPNEKIADFIVTNPIQAMMAYTNRTAAQYEFYKTFGFQDPEIVMGRIAAREARAGTSQDSINRLRRDFLHSYDRVAGIVIQNPEALSLRAAQVMKDLATLNYLGSAGFSTLPDAAVVMMQTELKPLFSQMFRVLDNKKVRMNAMEARLAGEMLEILKGDVHLRLMEDMLNNPFQNTFVSKAKNVFFQVNLLGPMTRTFKMMSSMAHSHTIIDYSIKLANGNAKSKEIQWLARMGINKADATKINKMRVKGFIEDSDGFYLANTKAWDDESTTRIFRRTLNAGVKNTVLMGSPADKPIVTDGVFYIPMRIGKMMGLKEDRRFKGYARMENGLLGMPFQFYSYSFAALNKITTLYSQDQVTNRVVGIGMSMALAYMGMQLKYRNNPFVLEQMSYEDRVARSFDMSGLAALYSDLYYTSIQTSLALGGPDLTMGLISPKFPQEKDYIDAATTFGGAGVSITSDLARAAFNFTQGNYGEGAKDFISNLPGARLWFLKDQMNDMTRGIAGRLG